MAANAAPSNMPYGRRSLMPTLGGISIDQPNSPSMYASNTSLSFLSRHPPFPNEDGFAPRHLPPPPPRPAVCEAHFHPSQEDVSYHTQMSLARAHAKFREPKALKEAFCSPNKGGCQTHKSTCFTLHIGQYRSRCRTESVALREIQIVLGLCWTCKTW